MRIPISDTQVGYIHSYSDGRGYFSYEDKYSPYMKGYRKATWVEFKGLYPFRCGNIRFRSEVKTKYCK